MNKTILSSMPLTLGEPLLPHADSPANGSAALELVEGAASGTEYRVSVDGEEKRIKDFAGASEAEILLIADTHSIAGRARQRSLPLTSRYAVGVAAILQSGDYCSGCNLEYGGSSFGEAETRALHGEEVLVARAVHDLQLGRSLDDGTQQTLRIVSTNPDSAIPGYCCGNCLDVMRTFATPETLLAPGCSKGDIEVYRYDQVLPNAFNFFPIKELSSAELRVVKAAIQAGQVSFNPLSASVLGARGASALLSEGESVLISGTRIDGADYHPISEVDSLISALFAQNTPFISTIALASPDGGLSGRDRQKLFQLAQALGQEDSLEILLVATDRQQAARLTPKRLLPFGFGADDIGLKDEVKRRLANYRK